MPIIWWDQIIMDMDQKIKPLQENHDAQMRNQDLSNIAESSDGSRRASTKKKRLLSEISCDTLDKKITAMTYKDNKFSIKFEDDKIYSRTINDNCKDYIRSEIHTKL